MANSSDPNGVEMNSRRQGTVKQTAYLGKELGQGGDHHMSSSDTLPELLGQGKSTKRKAKLIGSFGGFLGQR